MVDSDSEDILSIGKDRGATPLKRPAELATDKATGDDLAYWEAINYRNSEIIVHIAPTSPFIKSTSIDKAIKILMSTDFDSVAGAYSEVFYRWINGKPIYYVNNKIPNSQDMTSVIYETTGFYANKTKYVLKRRKRLNPCNTKLLYLSKIETVDINTEEDFKFAEIVWKGLNNK